MNRKTCRYITADEYAKGRECGCRNKFLAKNNNVESIKPGEYIRAGVTTIGPIYVRETFCVKVVAYYPTTGTVVGTIDNDLQLSRTHELVCNESIIITRENIIEILGVI